MMYILMVVVFIIGYMAIALEHPLKIDKAASGLLTGVLCWVIFVLGAGTILADNADFLLEKIARQEFTEVLFVEESLHHHLGEISQILFFLLGAMTIVEMIDAHEGFAIITDKITTLKRSRLLWILCILTFFLSAALDNLTTAIVMSALLKKLIKDKKDLWLFAGMIILSANAGGAWSPIGDVTTIMLWVKHRITAGNIIIKTIIPSLVSMLVPLAILARTMKGNIERPDQIQLDEHKKNPTTAFERNLVFAVGVGSLLFVPIFKMITHLPPFMGVLFGLGVMWLVTEILHRSKNTEEKSGLSVISVLRRVDVPSVLFFLGILTAVAALQTAGHLDVMASFLAETFNSDIYLINGVIGLLSSIVDNVPLVAGAIGMYGVGDYPIDDPFWELLAYCAGTGGSCLIIGSAAGVAVMGILKIDFVWYVKKISLLALVGYLSGMATYYLMYKVMHLDKYINAWLDIGPQ